MRCLGRRPLNPAGSIAACAMMRHALLLTAQVAAGEPTQSGYLALQVVVEIQRARNGPRFQQRGQIQYLASQPANVLGAVAAVQQPPDVGGDLLREMDTGHGYRLAAKRCSGQYGFTRTHCRVAYRRMRHHVANSAQSGDPDEHISALSLIEINGHTCRCRAATPCRAANRRMRLFVALPSARMALAFAAILRCVTALPPLDQLT